MQIAAAGHRQKHFARNVANLLVAKQVRAPRRIKLPFADLAAKLVNRGEHRNKRCGIFSERDGDRVDIILRNLTDRLTDEAAVGKLV